jgi:hypothetical protein
MSLNVKENAFYVITKLTENVLLLLTLIMSIIVTTYVPM